jgi:hypothetical protein
MICWHRWKEIWRNYWRNPWGEYHYVGKRCTKCGAEVREKEQDAYKRQPG